LAGLLTCAPSDAFPVSQWPCYRQVDVALTAAGTVPDFHRSSLFIPGVNPGTIERDKDSEKFVVALRGFTAEIAKDAERYMRRDEARWRRDFSFSLDQLMSKIEAQVI
jgi:hypothetical protein